MKYVKSCCNKIDGYYQDEMGNWRETGKIGNQLIRSERHAEHMAMHVAQRRAFQRGDVMRQELMRYK